MAKKNQDTLVADAYATGRTHGETKQEYAARSFDEGPLRDAYSKGYMEGIDARLIAAGKPPSDLLTKLGEDPGSLPPPKPTEPVETRVVTDAEETIEDELKRYAAALPNLESRLTDVLRHAKEVDRLNSMAKGVMTGLESLRGVMRNLKI